MFLYGGFRLGVRQAMAHALTLFTLLLLPRLFSK